VSGMGRISSGDQQPFAAPAPPQGPGPRVLFLDDDPARAEVFLADNPAAVWVQTVAECLARLEERWDEVHLDHDLGGEQFVTCDREDCGMEVVRWLCLIPRPHLRETRFFIHSHNAGAVFIMATQMEGAGYRVESRPFGAPPPLPPPSDPFWGPGPPRWGWLDRLRGLLRRPPKPPSDSRRDAD
jgi:hypothetical protein